MRVLLLIFSLIFLQNTVFAIDNAQVWNSYLGSAEKTIKSNWYKLSGLNRHQKECSTNLYFNIKNTGEIYGIKVLSSNCSDEIKNLAIKEFVRPKDVADTIYALVHVIKSVTGQNIILDMGQSV